MTLNYFSDNQAAELAKQVRQLDLSQGQDKVAFDAIRRQVSRELLNSGERGEYDPPDLAATALGLLDSASAMQRLITMVAHCAETFYLEDRVLSAVVVPVAVWLKALTKTRIGLTQGDAAPLRDLCSLVQHHLGSKLYLGSGLFSGESLYELHPRALLERLIRMESGTAEPPPSSAPPPNPLILYSDHEPQWHMAYFLGVEVTALDAPRRLNSDPAQFKLRQGCMHARQAVHQAVAIFKNKDVRVQAQCHGVWYLNRGVQEGTSQLRVHRLRAFVAQLERGGQGVRFHYAQDAVRGLVRLLASSQMMSAQFCWKPIGSETLESFRRELQPAIALVIPANEVLEVKLLEWDAYEAAVRNKGLCWAKGVLQ